MVSRRKTWIKQLKKGRFLDTAREIADFHRELKSAEFDLTIDLQGLFKSGVPAWLSRSHRRVGFDAAREFSYIFVNDRLPPYDPDRHALNRYLDVAEYLGAEMKDADKYILPRDIPRAREAEKLISHPKSLKIAVNPGAKWLSKLWPRESWQRLCRLLIDNGCRVFLTGGPDEREANLEISAGLEGLIDLTGQTGLRVLAEFYRLMDVVVCPDTGPMHLAAAVDYSGGRLVRPHRALAHRAVRTPAYGRQDRNRL